LNFKIIASVFVVLAVAFGGATGYLLAYPPAGSSYTVTSTVVSTSVKTITTASAQTATVTGSGSLGLSAGIAEKSGIGFYLTDGAGMTLYYRTSDDKSTGTSSCTGACVSAWPVFFAENLVLPPGINATSFGTAVRSDGMQQLTYNGWPLYHFSGDQKPGDTNGQGLGGVWFALALSDPPAPATTSTTQSVSSTSSTTSSSAVSSVTSAASTVSTASLTTSTNSTSTATSVSTTTTSSQSTYSKGGW
jgi:predicted lipoprotein with Yx(FWY)xxD motif